MPVYKNSSPGTQPAKFVLVFILQHKFTMDKSKLNLGANVGDIPCGVNRPEVNPAGLGGLFETSLRLGGSRLIDNPAGGCEERQDPVARLAVHEGRFNYCGPV